MTDLDDVARHHASAVRTAYADAPRPPVDSLRPQRLQRPHRYVRPGAALAVLGGVLVAVLIVAVGFVSLNRPAPLAPAAPNPSTATSKPSTATSSANPTMPAVAPDVTAADVEVADAFVAFAIDPGPATAQRLPLSPEGLRLGLGQELLRDLPIADVGVADNWQLAADGYFRGYVGPFSALTTLDQHVTDKGTGEFGHLSNEVAVSVGPYPHCASPPAQGPPDLATQRRVSVQPAGTSIDTCMLWFSVDLYLDDEGRISAVTLERGEP